MPDWDLVAYATMATGVIAIVVIVVIAVRGATASHLFNRKKLTSQDKPSVK